MPPSPVVVEVPARGGAAAQRLLGLAESAPKLMPAMVIGIFSSIGCLANRVPSTTSVSQRSRYPSSG